MKAIEAKRLSQKAICVQTQLFYEKNVELAVLEATRLGEFRVMIRIPSDIDKTRIFELAAYDGYSVIMSEDRNQHSCSLDWTKAT